jgi:BirA family biotin operon repressor/biotin-[acetyl-CoA-carboxylase] ligase
MTALAPLLPPGYRLVSCDAVGSTNDEAKRLARAGAAAGTIVSARRQTAGRGRRGRTWLSPPGNLYASFVLRSCSPAARAAQLGFVAALAVGDALREVAPGCPRIAYKWPNDVMIGGGKIAGLLLEAESGAGAVVDWLVLGIGINLVAAPAGTESPAISLVAACGTAPPPAAMLERLAARLDARLRQWRIDGFAPIRAAWLADAMSLGRPIRVRLDGGERHGRFRDLDPEGALLLDTEDGPRRIAAGEIFPAGGPITTLGPRALRESDHQTGG